MTFEKVFALVILIAAIILLQGCASIPIETGEKIVPPDNKCIPLDGTWQVVKRLGDDIMPYEDDPMLDGLAIFSYDKIVFGDNIITDIQYSIKRVEADDLLFYQYRAKAEDLGISNKKVDVVSISSNNRSLYEFIKIDDNRIITAVDNEFYMLTRRSAENGILSYDEKYIKGEGSSQEKAQETEILRSGILLGLKRISNPNNGQYDITYRTLWIRAENRNLYPTLETSNLFVPRKTGFWDIGSHSEKIDGYMYDSIYAYPDFLYDYPNMGHELVVEEPGAILNLLKDSHLRQHIKYVGNDYIAVENINIGGDASILDRRYQVLPIDNVQNSSGIKISDIVGKSGREAFLRSAQSSLEIKDIRDVKILADEKDEENFTVARHNGHWIMKGRVSYSDEYDKVEYLDFNINIIPPAELVNYDELCLSWNAIKTKLPSAVDAYASPNEDMLIIMDIDTLYIYSLEGNELSDKPIGKINLHEGEEVVMAEWATGVYVERWDKHFKAKKPIEVYEKE